MSQPSSAPHTNAEVDSRSRAAPSILERQSPAVDRSQVWNRGRAAIVPVAASRTSSGT